MIMTPQKVEWLWREMQKYRTLFSDLTRGDVSNFAALVIDANSLWFEVVHDNVIIGVVYFTELERVIDCETHCIFFDRRTMDKIELCRKIIKFMFRRFPLNRITATIPSPYYLTLRLAKKLGFQQEGIKRQSQLMGNNWVDEVIFGLLRSEVL